MCHYRKKAMGGERFNFWKRNNASLEGAFSRLTTLWFELPFVCEHKRQVSCGRIRAKVPAEILDFLGVEGSSQKYEAVVISRAESQEERGLGWLFVEVEEKNILFKLESVREGLRVERRLSLLKRGKKGVSEEVLVKEKSKELEIFDSFLTFIEKAEKREERKLVCLTCTLQEDGLPWSVV